jgi:RNA polymerase-binding protein DksA
VDEKMPGAAGKPAGAKKATAPRAAATKATATKATPTKATATKATATKATTTKITAKTASTKTAPATKAAVKKAPVTKGPVTKAPVTKAPTGNAAGAKAPGTEAPAPKSSAGKTSARKASTRAAGAGEPIDAAAIRLELLEEHARLTAERESLRAGLADVIRDSATGSGDDQADSGAKTFGREQEQVLVDRVAEALDQTERALARLDDGSYGNCESCGRPIGAARLEAFPRATLCVECKQREERR